MARLNRVSPIGVPQHIVQRGNNLQVCFGSEEDMKAYLAWLKEFSKNTLFDVHAWVLMRNNFTLTPIIRPQLFDPNYSTPIIPKSFGRMAEFMYGAGKSTALANSYEIRGSIRLDYKNKIFYLQTSFYPN